ncbi:MAG: asparagine synthase [Flaviaesturariibacter sp.]|nr:asparagine synthase [Flaviaesturariibacter sp.]
MCGIAGGFAFREEGKRYIDRIEEASCSIGHRGPDGQGVFREDSVALGHRRLSIIDTSAAANQPMHSANGRFCIVFNGEIFNFRELHKGLLAGRQLRTLSDTEVFLALFEKMGTDCFAELRGFFAAAIYDREKKELVVVRDRFGKKPVHVFADDDAILFGSELKSLLAFGIPREVDKTVLPYYFQLNYIPQPFSILKGVRKLLPGKFLRISAAGVSEHTYYELALRKEAYGAFTYDQAKTELVTRMEEAVRLRLIADVPLGAFLSGGIDSSVIVALASRHEQQLKTFSIGFKDQPFFDETRYAELVAKKYGTQHTVFRLTTDDLLSQIDTIFASIDEPFADSSLIPTYILCQLTRKHVTVALSGDGGDEVFAGYNKYEAERNVSHPSRTAGIVKGLAPLWKILPKSRNSKLTNTFRQLHRFAEVAGLPPQERYWRWASMLPEAEARGLFAGGATAGIPLSQNYHWTITGTDLNEVLLADMNLVLVGDMLVKVDMMSMANSLEVRSPFLDQEVVEFAFGLPEAYKIDKRLKKKIVQDSFRDLLPAELYNRPKQGFDLPLLDWFRKELWSLIDEDLLADAFVREQGIFNADTIAALKKKMMSANPEDSHETIWALIVFQYWWKKNIA